MVAGLVRIHSPLLRGFDELARGAKDPGRFRLDGLVPSIFDHIARGQEATQFGGDASVESRIARRGHKKLIGSHLRGGQGKASLDVSADDVADSVVELTISSMGH